MKSLLVTMLAGWLVYAGPAAAQDEWVNAVVAAYRDAEPVDVREPLEPEAARRVQSRVIDALRHQMGGVFGYKAGLTSAAAQERFDVDEPVLGTLLTGMILENGATVSLSDGVRLLIEADLLVRVGDRRINQAQTRAAAFAALDFVAPFLEIPDVVVKPGNPVDGAVLTAINSGARLGVIGNPVPVAQLSLRDLTAFTVQMSRDGESAAPLSSGAALMGHPLDVVLWILEETRSRGIILEPGDWLSLGSLTRPTAPQAGESYQAVYEGLGPARLEVSAGFTR